MKVQHKSTSAPFASLKIVEHLSILTRWHHSTWRDGEWIEIDWPVVNQSTDTTNKAKIPYRKLVNAIGRVGRPTQNQTGRSSQNHLSPPEAGVNSNRR
jgi:hypothetical protein